MSLWAGLVGKGLAGLGDGQGLWAGKEGPQGRGWGGGPAKRPHFVHKALRVEQRGPCNGVHLQRVASVGKQEL